MVVLSEARGGVLRSVARDRVGLKLRGQVEGRYKLSGQHSQEHGGRGLTPCPVNKGGFT